MERVGKLVIIIVTIYSQSIVALQALQKAQDETARRNQIEVMLPQQRAHLQRELKRESVPGVTTRAQFDINKNDKTSRLVLSDGQRTVMVTKDDASRLSAIINSFVLEGQEEKIVLEIPNVTAPDVYDAVFDEKAQAQIRAVHPPRGQEAATIYSLSYDVRVRRAQDAARALAAVTRYSSEELQKTINYLRAAQYLEVPELEQLYGRAIADMLLCPECLAVLARDASLLGQIPQGREDMIAEYSMPWPWKIVCKIGGKGFKSAKFSRDGKQIVSVSQDGANLWDAATGNVIHNFTRDTTVTADFSGDGMRLLIAPYEADRDVAVFDMKDNKLLYTLSSPEKIEVAKISPNGKCVITGSSKGRINIWQEKELMTSHQKKKKISKIESVDFSADGAEALALNREGDVEVCAESDEGPLWYSFANNKYYKSARYSPVYTHTVVAVSKSGGTVTIHNMDDMTEQTLMVNSQIQSAQFSPNGQWVLTVHYGDNGQIWNVSDGTLRCNLVSANLFHSPLFSPDGALVIAPCYQKDVFVWDALTGNLLQKIDIYQPASSEFSSDGKKVVIASTYAVTVVEIQRLPLTLPGVTKLPAIIFMRLLFWAQEHNQKITDQKWLKIANAVRWNEINGDDRNMLQAWIKRTMVS